VTTRVLTICGSLQRASANRAALDVVEEFLRTRSGVDIDATVEIAAIPAFNPDVDAPPDSAVGSLRSRLAAADVVVVASPEYAAGPPGALKNAFDWIVGSAELYGKPVALISAGTSGGAHARHQLTQSLTWQGAHVVASLGIAAPRTKTDADGRFTDPPTIAAIERFTQLALDVVGMPAADRVALAEAVTAAAGVEPGHIAPA
jgi:NAD(P)H-dependent FMN reductase